MHVVTTSRWMLRRVLHVRHRGATRSGRRRVRFRLRRRSLARFRLMYRHEHCALLRGDDAGLSETEPYSPTCDMTSHITREYLSGNTHLAFYHDMQLRLYLEEQGRVPLRVISSLLERGIGEPGA